MKTMMMLRYIFLVVCACAMAGATSSEEEFALGMLRSDQKTVNVAELAELIIKLKNQIKEALKEVIMQIVENVKEILDGIRRKIVYKLGSLTVIDALGYAFGGVTNLVHKPKPILSIAHKPENSLFTKPSVFETQPAVKPTQSFGTNNFGSDFYSNPMEYYNNFYG